MKILLVDDEAIALQTMENIIRQSDFKSLSFISSFIIFRFISKIEIEKYYLQLKLL